MQEESGNGYQSLADASFILGAAVIILIAAILLLSAMLFATGHHLLPCTFWLALAVAVAATWLLCNHCFPDRRWQAFASIVVALTVILLLGIYISGKCYDISFDGQAYQQEGTIQLANGWNPFHDQPLQIASGIWLNHYAKGAWIASASIYILTGHIEQGKVFNMLLIAASFLFCLSALLTHYKYRLPESLLFSALAAVNPISILQVLTFYIDGQLSSMLVIILALLFMVVKKPHTWSALLLLLSVIVTVNIKFTALPYILALGLPVVLYLFFIKAKQPLKLVVSAFSIGLIVGVLFVGFNPYVTNTIRNGNPFYPLAGHHARNIITDNSPVNFHHMNRFEELFISTFSKSENAYGSQSTHWKWPFTISEKEWTATWVDTRVAGLGPLFGGAILLSLFLLATTIPLDKKKTLVFTGLCLLIICSALVNPDAWWARYAPQLWLLPVLCAMLALSLNNKPQKILGLALVFTLILNLSIVSVPYFAEQYIQNALLRSQLTELSKAPLVLVCFRTDYSNRTRLTEAGVHYRIVPRLIGPSVHIMDNSDTTYRVQ